MLLIKKCNDSQMWYAGLVGTTVYHEPNTNWEADGVYKSRDLGGCLNIVRMGDAEVIGNTPLVHYHQWIDGDLKINSVGINNLWFYSKDKEFFFDKDDIEVMAKHFGLL